MKNLLSPKILIAFLIPSSIAMLANASSSYVTSHSMVQRYRNAVVILSAPEMEGRGIGTQGLAKAEQFVASAFQEIGLKPFAPTLGSALSPNYYQRVPVLTGVDILNAELSANQNSLAANRDFIPASISGNGSISGYLMDVGFGTIIPELQHNDYASKDLNGKIALIRRHLPENTLTLDKQKEYSDLFYKISLARERGATGVFFWTDEPSTGDNLPALTKQYRTSSIPIFHVTRAQAVQWIQLNAPVHLEGRVELQKTFSPAHNVVGSLGDNCTNSSQAILVGAHLDHLGFGDQSSLEPTQKGLHAGADDNASGVAGVLEAAYIIKNTLPAPYLQQRCFVFAAFTAEEQGIVGSNALVSAWRKQNFKPKAVINLDMIGRLRENKLVTLGTNSAQEWSSLLNKICQKHSLSCSGTEDASIGRSDHAAFLVAGVPAIHLNTGTHPDYHRTTDTAEKINHEGGAAIASLTAELAINASEETLPFAYTSPPQSNTGGDLPSRGAYLGTMPDYAGTNLPVPGVLLSGAVPGSPAERAGVLPGDILIAINEHQTPTIDDFMTALRNLKPGDHIVIRIFRDGQMLALPATVGSKRKTT
jgi:hypothetical protein